MLEIARFEGRHRVRGAAAATAAFSGFALFYIFIYPAIAESMGADLDRLLEAYPEALSKAFGIQSLATMEGYLASELYTFGWMLIVGIYFAYAAASLIAADVERERMDMLLSLPVSRARVVLEQFASLAVPLVALSTVVPVMVLVGTTLVDFPIPVTDVVALHLLSIPYLTTCAGIGLVASVVFDRASLAQRAAAGVVAGLFFAESLLLGTDFGAAGAISPSRYVDPNAVLRESEYAVADGAVLVVATLALAALAVVLFRRKDLE